MQIINLTQHSATADQVSAGVVEPADKAGVQKLLTFEELPAGNTIARRAMEIASLAKASGCEAAMIGGAPYLMGPLAAELAYRGIKALYAFSVRDSVEVTDPKTGEVRKTQVFRHAGFVDGTPGVVYDGYFGHAVQF